MSASGTTTFRCILDKPLNELTEDDISQLTREDCRKYLKDKGMRRPSWNKSQAIQQVVSLKALLEPCEDSGAGALRKIGASPPMSTPRVNSVSADSGREVSGNGLVSVSPEESVVHMEKEPSKSAFQERPTDTDNNIISPRSQRGTGNSIGQLTIFYCGRVSVYDGVPPDKAQEIMHLAESPIHFSDSTSVGSFPWHSQTASDKGGIPPIASIFQPINKAKVIEYTQQGWVKGNRIRDPDADGQASRKVSLQRYLEKRKDRGRIKIKKHSGVGSSSMDVYLNHQLRTTASNCITNRSSTNSMPQPGLPQTFSCTADNQPRVASLPVDLNEMFSSAELDRKSCELITREKKNV